MAHDEHPDEHLYTGPIDLSELRADGEVEVEAETPEISYDEQRYPARPGRLRPRDQFRGGSLRRITTGSVTPAGTSPVRCSHAQSRTPPQLPPFRRSRNALRGISSNAIGSALRSTSARSGATRV